MKLSLITISPEGCIWKTMRDGQIVEGRIQPDVPQDKNGDYIYVGSSLREAATSYGRPFSDLPVFFDATPKLEKFFAALALREFSKEWCGIVLKKPAIAVHFVGYSRMIQLGEQLALRDCIFRWVGGDAVVCKWPTPYTDTQIKEILLGNVFKKQPNLFDQPTPSGINRVPQEMKTACACLLASLVVVFCVSAYSIVRLGVSFTNLLGIMYVSFCYALVVAVVIGLPFRYVARRIGKDKSIYFAIGGLVVGSAFCGIPLLIYGFDRGMLELTIVLGIAGTLAGWTFHRALRT